MAFTAPDSDLLDAPQPFRAPDDEIVKPAGFVAPADERFAVPLDAYQKAYAQTGLVDPEEENSRVGASEFFKAIAADKGSQLPALAAGLLAAPFAVAGKGLNAAAQDAMTTISGHPEYGGNVWQLLNRTSPDEAAQPLPYQETLRDISQQHPAVATAGKIAAGTVEAAPMMAAGLPAGPAGRLLALGFTGQMIQQGGQAATALGNELGKNPEDRNADTITTAISDLTQSGVMSTAMGFHVLKSSLVDAGNALADKFAPRGMGDVTPSEPPPSSPSIKGSATPETAAPSGVAASTAPAEAASGFVAPPDEVVAKTPPTDADGVTVRTPDGQVDPVQTALNKLRAEGSTTAIKAAEAPTNPPLTGENPNLATNIEKSDEINQIPNETGESKPVAPTIAARAAETPDKPVTMADLAQMQTELKAALTNPFKPAENTVLPENYKIPENSDAMSISSDSNETAKMDMAESKLTPAPESATKPAGAPAETITGQNGEAAPDASGATSLASTQMPAEGEKSPTRRARPSFFIRPRSDGVPDILDAVQELGGIKPPGKLAGGEYDGFREAMTGPARLLVKRGAKHAPDTIIDELHSTAGFQRIQTPDDLFESIKAAVKQRDALRANDRAASGEAKQTTQFQQKAIQGQRPKTQAGNVERVSANHLLEGDTFEVQGHKFEVQHLEFDNDNNLAFVQVKDGPKFGVQQIGADDVLHFDKDSFEAGPQHDEHVPEPVGPGMALKEGGDLFSAPESVADQKARLASEKAAASAKTARENMLNKSAARLTGADVDTNQEMFGRDVLTDKSGQQALFDKSAPSVLELEREHQTDKTQSHLPAEISKADGVGRRQLGRETGQSPTDLASALLADADSFNPALKEAEKERPFQGSGGIYDKEGRERPRAHNGNLAYLDQYRQTLLRASEAAKSSDPQTALQTIVDEHNHEQSQYDRQYPHTKNKTNDALQMGWGRRLQGSADAITQIGERLKNVKSFKAKAEQLALNLESLKTGIGKGGQLHAFGIAADLWDRAVSIAQKVIRAGGSIADAITAAIAHIKENHQGAFDEQGARWQLNLATRDVERPDGTPTPERERTAAEVKADVTTAQADLTAATEKSVKEGGKDNRAAMFQATAKYRTLRDELLHHPDYIAEQLAKQNAAVTEANELLKPLGKKVGPEQFPNPVELRGKLSPDQFKRFQELQQQIEDSHAELSRMPGKMVTRVHGEMQDDGRLPKSAPLNPDAGRSLDKVTDWLRENGVDSPKKTLAERLNLADKLTGAFHDAKTTLQKSLLKMQALWKATVESYKAPPVDTDFRHVIKSWIYSDQRTGLATHQFVKELVAKVPNADRRKAMSVWLDADGDKSVLEFQRQSVPDAYRRVWEAALKLTPDEKALALKIKSDFAAKLEDGMNLGLLDKGREDYGVPQRWKLKPEPSGDYTGDQQKGTPGNPFARLDSRNPFFSFQRETPSYFDGIMSKGVPENLDIAHLVATYDQAFHKSLSSRGMIGALQEAKAKDGLPVVKLSGSASVVSNDGGKTYFVDSKARNKSDVSADGRPYQPVDHSALRGWALRMKDENGNPIIVKGDMLVHPDHVAYLKNELTNSGLRDVPFLGGLMQTQAFLKASKLSASAFHLATIGEHMASHMVNPFTNGFKIDLRQPDQTLLVRNGLELGMGAPQAAFAEGLASGHGGLFNKIPGLGDLSAKVTDWMFKDYIPTIMMKVGLKALDANRKRYGDKLTPDQVAELTARQMNAAGGLLNKRLDGSDGNFWGQLGANKTMMDINSMLLMAPRFLEARMKVVGQALKPYGAEQRKMLILQAGILYAGARVLNQLLDGDPHWRDNPFSVVYHGRAYSIRTIVGDFYHLISDPASFAAGRLAPVTKMGIEDVAMGGRDLRTGARKDIPFETQSHVGRFAQNIVMDMANWLTPITAEGALPGAAGKDTTPASAALTSVGIGSRKFTAANQVRDLAANFNRNSPDAKAQKFQADRDNNTFGHSDYAKLDSLLDAGQSAKAQTEYNALKAEGKTAAQIATRYDRSAPFTGNAEREQKFVNSLTPDQKATYQKARAEQQARQRAFGALRK